MASDPPKLFRHQSGLMQAVKAEVEDLLEITKDFTTQMISQPPPAALFRKPPPGEGTYSSQGEVRVDQVDLQPIKIENLGRLGSYLKPEGDPEEG